MLIDAHNIQKLKKGAGPRENDLKNGKIITFSLTRG